MTSLEFWFCWHSKPHFLVTISGLRWSLETSLILLRVTAGHKMLDKHAAACHWSILTRCQHNPPQWWNNMIYIMYICNIYITVYPQWDRYPKVGLPWRGFSGEGITLWLRIWKRPFLTGQWLPGRCGGGGWYSVEWNDFNLELNVVLDVLIWALVWRLVKICENAMWAWIPPASTCTVQKCSQGNTNFCGGWNFKEFGDLWFKVHAPFQISMVILMMYLLFDVFFAFWGFFNVAVFRVGVFSSSKRPLK